MSRKDFEAVASRLHALRFSIPEEQRCVIDAVACELADVFVEINPRFDREKFLDAIGAEDVAIA